MPVPCAFFFSGGARCVRPRRARRLSRSARLRLRAFPAESGRTPPLRSFPQRGETSENGESCKSGKSCKSGGRCFCRNFWKERPNGRDFRRRETIPGPEHRCLRRLSRSFPDCRGNAERPLNSRAAPAPPDARFSLMHGSRDRSRKAPEAAARKKGAGKAEPPEIFGPEGVCFRSLRGLPGSRHREGSGAR